MRTLRDVLWLAAAGLWSQRGRGAIVAAAVALAVALPVALAPVGPRLAARWTVPAERVSVAIGAPGSSTDGVLTTVLLTDGALPATVSLGAATGPLEGLGLRHVAVWRGARAAGGGVVAAGPGLLPMLGLEIGHGRGPVALGEVALGASRAASVGVGIGDKVVATAADPGDPSGSPPLRLTVVGILAPAGSSADALAFTTLETGWALRGALHGHAPEATVDGLEPSLAGFDPSDPSVAPASWHLHGERADQPVHAVLVATSDPEARDRLLGRIALRDDLDAVRPSQVVASLMAQVGRVVALLAAVAGAVGAATLALAGLVLALLWRARADELSLLHRLGASRARVAALVATETGALLLLGVIVGVALAWAGSGALADALAAVAAS